MYKPHVSRQEKVADAVLENAKSTVTIVAALADGGIPCPPLKVAATVAKQAVECIQKIRTNQEDSADLARLTYDYIITIYQSVGNVKQAQISEKLSNDIQEVERVLGVVRDGARELHAKNFFKRALSKEGTAKKIQGLKDNLAQSLLNFGLSSFIDLRVNQEAMTVALQNIQLRLPEPIAQIEATSMMITSSPPPAPSNLLGREILISDGITALTAPDHAHLAILGHGGIGKTSVALAIIHSAAIIAKFGKSRYFVPCDSIITTAALVNALLQILTGDASVSVHDPLASLQSCISGLESFVLVLDNFETTWTAKEEAHLTQILLRLAAFPQVHLIVTMRGISAPARGHLTWTILTPDLLSLKQATDLYLTINPHTSPSQYGYLHKLLEALDGLPLAVRLLAGLGDINNCQELLQLWVQKSTALLATSAASQHRLTSLDFSLSLSLESSRIVNTPGAYGLLVVLCHLPDGVKGGISQLKKMGLGFLDLDTPLYTLLTAALVTKDTLGTLQVLSPIRHYVLSKPVENTAQLSKLYCYYIKLMETYSAIKPGHSEFLTAIKHLGPEIGNIVSLTVAGLQEKASPPGLADAAFMFTMFQSWYSPSTEIIELLVAKGDTHPQLPQYLQHMGHIQMQLCNYAQAISQLEEAHAKFKVLGNLEKVAECLQALGDIQRIQCKYPQAINRLEEATAIYKVQGNAVGAAHCLQRLGEIQRVKCNYSQAISMLKDAQSQFMTLGNLLEAAHCLKSLGDIHRMQNNYPQAISMLKDAQEEFKALGHRLGAAQCLRYLGDIQRMQGNYPQAISMLQDAQHKFEALGDILGVAQCLLDQGDTQKAQSNYPQAITVIEDAQGRFEALGNFLGAVQCLQQLGVIHKMQGNYIQAISMLEDAHRKFEAQQNLLGAGQCLLHLGDIHRWQGNNAQSIPALEQAQADLQKAGAKVDYAWSSLILASVYWDSNLREKAIGAIQSAKTLFLELHSDDSVQECELKLTKWYGIMASQQPADPPDSTNHIASS